MRKRVVALDLGSTKVAGLAAELDDNGQLVAQGLAVQPCDGLRRGLVFDLEETSRAVDGVVRKLQNMVEDEISGVVAGVGGAQLESVNAQGFVPIVPRTRPVSREDVLHVINHSRQMMLPPDREQIQAIPREFRVDGQRGIQKPIGLNGSKLEVITHLVTGQTTHLTNLEQAISMAGRKVEGMVANPLASALGVLSEADRENGTVVIDIGGGTTSIAVFANGAVAYTVVVPIGSQHVTNDIHKLLKTSPEEGERLKVKYGASLASVIDDRETVDVSQLGELRPRPMLRKVLCEIIESRMREIAVMARQQIEKSGQFGVLPGGVVITGGGAQLPATDSLFEQVLQHMRVRRGLPKAVGGYGREMDRPELAAVAGIARFALEAGDDELVPASGNGSWKDRIRTLKSLFGGKA